MAKWDDSVLELAFLRRFGEKVRITRERVLGGTTVLVFQPLRAAI